MADIKDSVGDGGLNRVHDVALVQALLVVARDASRQSYLPSYDGVYGNSTKLAIAAFQKDHKLALPEKAAALAASGSTQAIAKAATKRPAGAATQEKSGFMAAGGPTLKALTGEVRASGHADLRIIAETKVVYWPGSAKDAAAQAASLRANTAFDAKFRENVARLVEEMYEQHKIVLSIPASGGRRTFQKQYQLATIPNKAGKLATGAGPGESNHNFGMAVDIGFNGFKWLTVNGQAEVDDYWLNSLKGGKAAALWKARNKIAKGLGLFETSFPGDIVHLQNFDDANISMSRSLVDLMNRTGKLRWQVVGQIYSSDLGLGGKFYPMGKSEQIWSLKSTLTAKTLSDALDAAATAAAARVAARAAASKLAPSPNVANGKGSKTSGVSGAASAKATKVDAAAVQAMKTKLKADFETAEKQAQQWRPIP